MSGFPVRAYAFQSIERTSSPGTYGRNSSNSMPRPRKTAWYSPRKRSFTSRRARISMARTRSSISLGRAPGPSACWRFECWVGRAHAKSFMTGTGSGDVDAVEDAVDEVVRRELLRLRLVGGDDAVAKDIVGERLHVVGHGVGAAFQERLCSRCLRKRDAGARRGSVGDEGLHLGHAEGCGP